MRRACKMGVVLVSAGLIVSGCFGPFNLTRRLYNWNEQIAGKWEREFVFLLLAWLPVYGLAVAGDAIAFNSMEFWTGNNPVDPPRADIDVAPKTKRLVRGDAEALLTYTRTVAGPELLIEQFREGLPTGSLHIERHNGRTFGMDVQGNVVLSAESLPDGTVVVRDGNGREIETYPAKHVDRVIASARSVLER